MSAGAVIDLHVFSDQCCWCGEGRPIKNVTHVPRVCAQPVGECDAGVAERENAKLCADGIPEAPHLRCRFLLFLRFFLGLLPAWTLVAGGVGWWCPATTATPARCCCCRCCCLPLLLLLTTK